MYYFFQRFSFGVFLILSWGEKSIPERTPRFLDSSPSTPRLLTHRSILSQFPQPHTTQGRAFLTAWFPLGAGGGNLPSLPHCCQLQAFQISRWEQLGQNGWARGNRWEQASPHHAVGPLRKPRNCTGFQNHPPAFWRGVPGCERRNPPTAPRLFLTSLSYPF